MNKIKKLPELSKICKKLKDEGKDTGLVTGKFDVLHIDHLDIFHFAKKYTDTLIVGIDNDRTIKLSRGNNRPICLQNDRAKLLSELEIVDYVFILNDIFKYNTNNAQNVHRNMLMILKPSAVITNLFSDKYFTKRKKIVEYLGIKFISQRSKKKESSSRIINILMKGS